MRVTISLDCTDCKRKNYSTNKNKQKTTDKVELKKSAVLSGDISTQRIVIEDGAFFKGGIDIRKAEVKTTPAAPPFSSSSSPTLLGGRRGLWASSDLHWLGARRGIWVSGLCRRVGKGGGSGGESAGARERHQLRGVEARARGRRRDRRRVRQGEAHERVSGSARRRGASLPERGIGPG